VIYSLRVQNDFAPIAPITTFPLILRWLRVQRHFALIALETLFSTKQPLSPKWL